MGLGCKIPEAVGLTLFRFCTKLIGHCAAKKSQLSACAIFSVNPWDRTPVQKAPHAFCQARDAREIDPLFKTIPAVDQKLSLLP
jgi:hypothetical protein